jgi:hypothetical protein
MFSTNLDIGRSHKQEMIEVKRVDRKLSTKNYLEWSSKLLNDIKILREGHGLLYTPRDLPESTVMHCQFHEHVCSPIETRQDQQNDCDRPYL